MHGRPRQPSQRKIITPNSPWSGTLFAAFPGAGPAPREGIPVQHVAVLQHAQLDGLDIEIEQPPVTRHVRVRHDADRQPDVTRLRIQGGEILRRIHLAADRGRSGLRIGGRKAGAEDAQEREDKYARETHGSRRDKKLGPETRPG
jgi:hypothetical protein